MPRLSQFAAVVILSASLPALSQDPPEKEPYRRKDKDWAIFYRDPPIGDILESDLRSLNIARLRIAQQTSKYQRIVFDVGSWQDDYDPMYPMVQNIVNAYLELGPIKEDRIMILNDHLEFLKGVEATAKKRFDLGVFKKQDMLMITHTRIDAEIQLLKAKAAK